MCDLTCRVAFLQTKQQREQNVVPVIKTKAKDYLIANCDQGKERQQKVSQEVNTSPLNVPCSAQYLLGVLVQIVKYHLIW